MIKQQEESVKGMRSSLESAVVSVNKVSGSSVMDECKFCYTCVMGGIFVFRLLQSMLQK